MNDIAPLKQASKQASKQSDTCRVTRSRLAFFNKTLFAQVLFRFAFTSIFLLSLLTLPLYAQKAKKTIANTAKSFKKQSDPITQSSEDLTASIDKKKSIGIWGGMYFILIKRRFQ